MRDTVREVEFRDGTRDIPSYMADLMAGLETYMLTYDQAVRIINRKLAADHANTAMNKVIREHFRQWGR